MKLNPAILKVETSFQTFWRKLSGRRSKSGEGVSQDNSYKYGFSLHL